MPSSDTHRDVIRILEILAQTADGTATSLPITLHIGFKSELLAAAWALREVPGHAEIVAKLTRGLRAVEAAMQKRDAYIAELYSENCHLRTQLNLEHRREDVNYDD